MAGTVFPHPSRGETQQATPAHFAESTRARLLAEFERHLDRSWAYVDCITDPQLRAAAANITLRQELVFEALTLREDPAFWAAFSGAGVEPLLLLSPADARGTA